MCYLLLEILTLQCVSRRNNIPSASGPAKVTGAIQKVSQSPLSRWHQWGWQPAPVSAPFPSPTFAVSSPPGIPSSSPSLHMSKRFPHFCPSCPGTRVCALTWLLWLGSGWGGSSWPLSARKLFPEAPRLTGIHSCSSATSSQSLSRKDFYSSHSWEQLPVRSETNKKTTLKATLNQITTEPHTPGCRHPSASLLTASAQLKWHICKASTSLCINQLRKLSHSL